MSGNAIDDASNQPERFWQELAESQLQLIKSPSESVSLWQAALQAAAQLAGSRQGWIEAATLHARMIQARLGLSGEEARRQQQSRAFSEDNKELYPFAVPGQIATLVPLPEPTTDSLLILPLAIPGRLSGRIALLLPTSEPPSAKRLQILELFADFVATQIDRNPGAPSSHAAIAGAETAGLIPVYQRLMQRSLAGMFRATESGQILECNPACARLMGFDSPEEMLRINSHTLFIHPNEREKLWKNLLDRGGSALIECVRRRKDGRSVRLLQDLQLFSEEPEGELILHGTFFELSEQSHPPRYVEGDLNLFRKIVENYSDAIFLVDAEAHILYSGPASEKIFGYRPAELLYRNGFDFVHPEDQLLIREQRRKLIEGAAVISAEFRVLHRNGLWRWVEMIASNHLDDPDLRAIILNYRDITERRQRDEEVHKSERRHQLIFEATGDAIWDWDMLTHAVRISGKLDALFGYPLAQITSSAGWWYTHIHPDDVERMARTLGRVMQRGQTFWSDEVRVLQSDGTWAFAFARGYVMRDSSGIPLRMTGAITDMTTHHRFQELLEAGYGRIVTGFLAINPEGWIVYANPAAQRLLGMPDRKLKGVSILNDEQMKQFAFTACAEKAMRTRTPQHTVESPPDLQYQLEAEIFPSYAGTGVHLHRLVKALPAPEPKPERRLMHTLFSLPMRVIRAVRTFALMFRRS